MNNVHTQALKSLDYCVNGLCLLDSTSRVYEKFGEPLKAEVIKKDSESEQHFFYDGIEVIVDNTKRVIEMRIMSNRFHTNRGITIEDSVASVQDAYGKPEKEQFAGELVYGNESTFCCFVLDGKRVKKLGLASIVLGNEKIFSVNLIHIIL
jgi:hypothetical protein